MWAACQDIAPKLDVRPESLREWVVQAQTDAGARSGPTSAELKEFQGVKRKVEGRNEADEILRAALVFLTRKLDPHHH